MQPAVIILAAGQASRMGAVKALLPLPGRDRGSSALRGLVELYRSVGVEEIVLVSGFHAVSVEAEAAALGVTVVRNPQPDQGMAAKPEAYSSAQFSGLRSRLRGAAAGPCSVPWFTSSAPPSTHARPSARRRVMGSSRNSAPHRVMQVSPNPSQQAKLTPTGMPVTTLDRQM